MKTLLVLLIAMSSAVIGTVAGRSRRPFGAYPLGRTIAIGVLAILVAEGGTVIWVGPPTTVFQPVIGGLVLGFVAGFFSGRKPPPKDELPPTRPNS